MSQRPKSPPPTLYAIIRVDGTLATTRTSEFTAEETVEEFDRLRSRGYPFRAFPYDVRLERHI